MRQSCWHHCPCLILTDGHNLCIATANVAGNLRVTSAMVIYTCIAQCFVAGCPMQVRRLRHNLHQTLMLNLWLQFALWLMITPKCGLVKGWLVGGVARLLGGLSVMQRMPKLTSLQHHHRHTQGRAPDLPPGECLQLLCPWMSGARHHVTLRNGQLWCVWCNTALMSTVCG